MCKWSKKQGGISTSKKKDRSHRLVLEHIQTRDAKDNHKWFNGAQPSNSRSFWALANVMNIQGTQNVGQHQTQDHQCAHVSNVRMAIVLAFKQTSCRGKRPLSSPYLRAQVELDGIGGSTQPLGSAFQKPNIKLRCSLVRKNIIIYYNLFILIYYYCVLSMNVLNVVNTKRTNHVGMPSRWHSNARHGHPRAWASCRAKLKLWDLDAEIGGFLRYPEIIHEKNLAGVCGCSCYKPCHIFSLSSRLLRWFFVCLCCSGWV